MCDNWNLFVYVFFFRFRGGWSGNFTETPDDNHHHNKPNNHFNNHNNSIIIYCSPSSRPCEYLDKQWQQYNADHAEVSFRRDWKLDCCALR